MKQLTIKTPHLEGCRPRRPRTARTLSLQTAALFSFMAIGAISCGAAEQPPADEILAFVRTKFPSDPLKITGSLIIKAPNGFTKNNLPVEMNINWGKESPTAKYNIGKESLNITWNNDVPEYQFSNPKNKQTDHILDSGVSWADLSFSMLWWPNSKLVGEGKKMDRACYIVEVPVPDSENIMRLWIEKKMGMLLETRTLDKKRTQLRRRKITTIKKMNGMWIGSDLEIKNLVTGSKTDLIVKTLDRPEPKKKSVVAFDAADSINQLAFDLYKKLSTEQEGNLFLSPYSISSALAMTYGGARGETETQMADVLHFGGQGATHPAFSNLRKNLNRIQKKGHIQLSVANSLWPQVDYEFLPDYLHMTKEFYGADIKPLDFKHESEAARLRINNWVETQTVDRIKSLIPKGVLNPRTRLVLANAIYFKGKWAGEFNKQTTHDAVFKIAPGNEIKVPMMSKTADFKMGQSKNFQALELPYKGDDLSMLILLPNKPGRFPILGNEELSALEFSETKAFLQLPRFKIESAFRLDYSLKAMGMPLAFSDKSDFSGMDGGQELYIGAVLHKAFVEVNEEGTEAAAATAVVIQARSMPDSFIVNRPFLFLIRENITGTILFIGRVSDPR